MAAKVAKARDDLDDLLAEQQRIEEQFAAAEASERELA
jgi:hypothetical protein